MLQAVTTNIAAKIRTTLAVLSKTLMRNGLVALLVTLVAQIAFLAKNMMISSLFDTAASESQNFQFVNPLNAFFFRMEITLISGCFQRVMYYLGCIASAARVSYFHLLRQRLSA